MSEKIIIMSFDSESKAFQAFSEIKTLNSTGIIKGKQMAVLKHVPNHIWGTANISEILYAKLYFHLKKPKTCTLRIWLLKFNLYKVLKTYVLGIIFTCLKSIYFLTFLSAKTHYQKQSNIFIPNKCLWCYY